jgi:hypothetical protein
MIFKKGDLIKRINFMTPNSRLLPGFGIILEDIKRYCPPGATVMIMWYENDAWSKRRFYVSELSKTQ